MTNHAKYKRGKLHHSPWHSDCWADWENGYQYAKDYDATCDFCSERHLSLINLMSMRHVSLHNTTVRHLHTPARTGLLDHAPLYNRWWAIAFSKDTDNAHLRFIRSAEVNIITEKLFPELSNYPTPQRASNGSCEASHIHTNWETMITDHCDIWSGLCELCSITITITLLNGTNYSQWVTEMALLLEQKEVYDIIKGYDGKLEEPTANPTDTGKAAFKDSMNRHGVARSTILLGMQPWIQAEYTVIDDVKTFWEKLGSAYKSKLKCNIFEIREDLWSIKLQDCRDVDNYPSWIARKVNNYNLCAGPTVPSTTDTDAPNMDSAKTIPKASEQEHIFYLLLGIPRNDEWKVVLELMRNKNATMTTTPDEIITKLVEKEAAIKIDNGLTPQALLFAKKGGKGGNGGKAGKGGKSPKRDMRDKKRDNNRKEKDLRKCLHCQRRGRITENC